MRALALLTALAAVWLALSGHYDGLILSFGALSCAFTAAMARRFGLMDREGVPLHLWRRLPGYWLWLTVEIAKANVDIARRILHPRLPIDPRVFEAHSSQKSDLGSALFANSITLTPGTIALDLRDGSILVHALTAESQAALETGEMDARVSAL